MAESAVSQVVTRLAGLLSQEFWLLYGLRDEVEWMERELRWIKCFLKDADAKGKTDERVKNWVNEVIHVAYQAEDAIDTFLIKVNHQSHGRLSCIKYWFKPSALVARRNVAAEIGKIKERLNEIKASREAYGIQNLSEDGDASNLISIIKRRHFSPQYSDDADVIGLFNDHKILLGRLIDQQQQRLCVISIFGIGGLGKTTLARKLYRDNAVSNHFRKCIWVTVSQENSLMELLRKMLEEVRKIEKEKLEKMTENDFIDMLNDSLRTQRFLIVLDDIWREDVWNQMQRSFPDVKNGSRVMITTRFLNVAKRADPRSTPYQLQLLNDDESMKLLLNKAFPYEDAEATCTSELLDIGRCLMYKCGGLPLALVVLGGLLSIKDKTPIVWRKVLETMDWAAEGRQCQEILALSYEDLPYHMKSCFLYLGAYPEDYDITGNVLIRQWIAEGFIPKEERKTMEDTGEAILEELIQRSLIHVNTRKNNGSVKRCGAHDLLLDFARSTAKKDLFLTVCSNENDQPTYLASSRRVAFHNVNITKINEISRVYTMHGLRTLMAFGRGYSSIYDSPIFRFELLRVLDLTELTCRIPNLRKLKVEINKEHQGTMLSHLLCGLHHLVSLCIEGARDNCPIEINTKDFPFHNHLLSLTLFGFWPKGGAVSEFPTYLTKLKLLDSRLEQDPMPKLERLQYLVTLKLFQNVYLGKTMVCSTGGFPSLKSLFIDIMPNLEEWRVERGAMPKLACLQLSSCEMLKVFPDLQHVMSLQELELCYLSQELMLRLQRGAGEDWYKIQHVPKLTLVK
ncbi:probable disease resistance protein RF9 [Dioscorea cayenensis subsp. rotundata]|uniref:Probable disease resistance protein RF9 n=1 Tax=Dioscorea cayennensis subsp. rotundata TaxID=55577 RepID=A0AB40AZS1_DIOCR|nr:probable disease resistance protein RF9 [Dioscorea cayenensis subsp. rotundata]